MASRSEIAAPISRDIINMIILRQMSGANSYPENVQ